jgi:DNA polymerase (family 10)
VAPTANRDIAEVFSEMADLLLIQGGDTYRIRAFRRTARVLENLGEPIRQLVDRNALASIPGLGEGSVHRVKQILRTGTCDDLQRLKADLPAGLREILELKGIGPKTVRVLWTYLRVSSMDELELYARMGKLATLPSMGAEAAQRILEAIASHRIRAARLPLHKALKVGNGIVQVLRQLPEAHKVALTGSARRGKATVGDLDVLVGAEEPGPISAKFLALPEAAEVLWAGEGRTSIRLESRQQVDLRIIPPESFGAGLHYFTGSQLHNIAVRERGQRRQLKISEHGVFRRDDESLIVTCEREEEVFAAVGLPYIAPELRENLGEIQAADQGRLPKLVVAADLLGDLHMHTIASDGKGTVLDMAEAALAIGHRYIAITEHSKSTEVANGLDERRLLAHSRHVRDSEQRFGRLRVMTGIEVDILADGSLDLDADVLRDLDWVVGSVHAAFDQDSDTMTHRLLRAIESGLIDVIGHPTGRMLGMRDGYGFDFERVARAAARCGVALELNGSPKRMDLDDVRAKHCKDLGVPVVLSTDSHAPEQIMRKEFCLAMARRGWIETKDVLNTQPWETLRDRRRDRLRRGGTTITFVEPTVPEVAPADEGVDALVLALQGQMTGELRDRLQAYLAGGDAELEAALVKISENPMQKAFELVFMS